ncbi:MAG: transporter, partial [Acidobacteria bacterium]|nr:transporter [Acidobacteriota bacterium]
ESWRASDVMGQTGLVLTRFRLPSGKSRLIEDDTPLPPGTLVVVVGNEAQREAGVKLLGRVSSEPLEANLGGFEVHRYFVSNPNLAGKTLGEFGAELDKLGAVVSRIRRGDVDLVADDDTVLQFGDRVKVVSYRQTEAAVRKFFGNSLQGLSETGYFSFAVGIILGLMLGRIPWPVPGLEEPVRLGVAGGPLVMALILGSRGRTGPFIWQMPFSTNLTLRHLGILLFLAAAGVKAGGGLVAVLKHDGLFLIGFGVALTVSCHLLLWWLLSRQNQQLPQVFGISSAVQTQPAALTFAAARVPHGPLNLAYATVYPLAMILKVVLAQLLLITS